MSSSSASDGRGGGSPPAPGEPGSIDERAIDRKLLGQLIARHGAPRQARPLTFAEQERRTLVARRARAIAAADPALVRHIERHERDAADIRHLPAEPPAAARREIARFDLDAWPIRKPGGEERELEPSEELVRLLHHRTPQAFLRDLHRPVVGFGTVQLRRVPSPTSAGNALARIRGAIASAMAHHSRDEALQPLATALMKEGMSELRTVLARPWADSRPATPLPLPGMAPGSEDHMWFGLSGGYDPDV